jgi:hypothetical protein
MDPRRAPALILAVVGLCLASCTAPAPLQDAGRAPGKILTVDNSGDAGYHVTLDVDVDDGVHLVYFDKQHGRLKYLRHGATAGLAEQIVDDACKSCLYPAIRVTSPDEPHILYYNDATQTLTYTYRQGNAWAREAVEWGKGTGMGANLLVDGEHRLHALYYSGDGYLKHAWRVPNPEAGKPTAPSSRAKPGDPPPLPQPEGLWASERVDRANGSEKVVIGFARQASGRLAASYLHWSGLTSELRVASQAEDGAWSTDVAARENNPGKVSALYLAPDGSPRVIYREGLKDRLMRAEFDLEGWKHQLLASDAYNLSLATDSVGHLVLAYQRMRGPDVRKGHLRMAVKGDRGWADFLVDDTPGSGSYLAAGLTASGRPVVAYFNEAQRVLKLFLGK